MTGSIMTFYEITDGDMSFTTGTSSSMITEIVAKLMRGI